MSEEVKEETEIKDESKEKTFGEDLFSVFDDTGTMSEPINSTANSDKDGNEIQEPNEFVEVQEGLNDNTDDWSEDLKMFQINAEQFVEYKKNVAKSLTIEMLAKEYTSNEKRKSQQRNNFSMRLLPFMKCSFYTFTVIYILLNIVLLYFKIEKQVIVDLFKWYASITLVQIISMISVMITYSFKDSEGIFNNIKEIINHQ